MQAVQKTWRLAGYGEKQRPAAPEQSSQGSEPAATSTSLWIHERLNRARLTNIERLIALDSYRRGEALGQLLLSLSARFALFKSRHSQL